MRHGRIAGYCVRAMVLAAILLTSALVSAPAHAAEATLDLAIAQAQRLIVPSGTTVLAASASQEGHWTFVNLKGERFTAATPDEMKRMAAVLLPGTEAGDTRLIVVVTEDTVFRRADALNALPRAAGLRLSTATGVYALLGDKPRLIQVNPKLRVELAERSAFDAVLLQLDRSVARGGLRILALDPSGPTALARRAGLDTRAKAELVDRIDPLRLKDAIAGLRGQTMLVTGRLEDKFLHFQVPGGPDRSVIAGDLIDAAAANDVNLIILDAPGGRQPGARNWLWQRAEVKGVDALGDDSGVDGLLATLASEARPLTVKLTRAESDRVTLVATPGPAALQTGGIGTTLSRVASDLTNNVTGRIEPTAIHMYLVSAGRQRELDRRLIRWLPSWATWGYLAALLLGLLGARVSWGWWGRLWPPESASDYPMALGFYAARAVRGVAYALIFMPLTAIVAAPMAAVGMLQIDLRRSRKAQ
jgi:hypothetical protein